jgi:hypothetical protein
MRLLAASLIVGGCVLAAGSTSASELRLDDAALDRVVAGLQSSDFSGVTAQDLGSIDERRNFLIGIAALVAAEKLGESYATKTGGENIADDPSFGPIDAGLRSFAASLLPPLDNANGDTGGGGGGGGIVFPDFPDFSPF